MKMYKFTSEDFKTRGGMKWEVGKTNRAAGVRFELCTDGVLHCYEDPVLAVLFAPLHVDYKRPRLIEVECSEPMVTDGLKFGCREQTMIREVDIPAVTTGHRVEFAIRVALLVCKDDNFVEWADNWLSGKDRSAAAAAAAARAAEAAGAASEYIDFKAIAREVLGYEAQ